MFTGLASLGLSLIPVKEREKVSGKVSNKRFVNSCLANSPSVYIYTVRSDSRIPGHFFHGINLSIPQSRSRKLSEIQSMYN